MSAATFFAIAFAVIFVAWLAVWFARREYKAQSTSQTGRRGPSAKPRSFGATGGTVRKTSGVGQSERQENRNYDNTNDLLLAQLAASDDNCSRHTTSGHDHGHGHSYSNDHSYSPSDSGCSSSGSCDSSSSSYD